MDRESSAARQTLLASHTPGAIRQRLSQGPSHSHLRDFIYGAIDGTVTTFAVVSSVAGAGLASGVVIVLGVANLIGDGFSMAVSNFQASRADEQLREQARQTELEHIRHYPEGEREEVRQIFIQKGFEGESLEKAVEVITSDVQQWVDTMLQDELGMSLESPSAWRAAMTTFVAFLLIGTLPLSAFLLQLAAPQLITHPYPFSLAITLAVFFAIGAGKSRFTTVAWWRSGLETLVMGGAAAGLAYLVGHLLKGLVA